MKIKHRYFIVCFMLGDKLSNLVLKTDGTYPSLKELNVAANKSLNTEENKSAAILNIIEVKQKDAHDFLRDNEVQLQKDI